MTRQWMKVFSLVVILVIVVGITPIKAHAGIVDDLVKGITDVSKITEDLLNQVKATLTKEFEDYNSTSWYANYVAKLVAVDGIGGYPDKTVKPNGTITKAEFTKILVASLYGIQDKTGTHWASGYINKAENVGILGKDEFTSMVWDKAINRQEMAKMICLTSEKALNEAKATNLDVIYTMIYDNDKIGASYKEFVYGAYSKGIISGYPDGTFKPLSTATRAEACTMLVKLLDSTERKVPGVKKWQTKTINGYVLPVDKSIVDYSTHPADEVKQGYAEMSLYVSLAMGGPLLDQWTASEEAMLSQFSQDIVKQVMDYVKLKTVETYVLDRKFPVGSRYIWVGSNEYNTVTSIQVFYY